MFACGKLAVLATPLLAVAATHELRITTLYKEGLSPRGAVLQVHIGSAPKPLRLLLDTGAKDILLDAKSASAAGLSGDDASSGLAVGFNGAPMPTRHTAAAIRIGAFEASAVPVRIASERRLIAGADGLIGANVFRAYVIEIDAKHNRLRLLPRDNYKAHGAVRFRSKGHLVFVETASAGLALLDTGSGYSVVDELAAPASMNREAAVPLRGVSGDLAGGGFRLPPMRFEIGSAVLWDREPMAINLKQIRAEDGVAVNAVIGYPALRDVVLQLDFESQTLRLLSSR